MRTFSLDDTIAAVATPVGEGGVGIVKISGPLAVPILCRLFDSAASRSPIGPATCLEPRRLTWGRVRDPMTGQVVDEALAAVMPAPHSYTRQDVAEIQSHGGIVAVRRILQLVLAAGARPAEPGEMTLRAFVNGRLDLAQAEAVLDIVQARTDAALRVAVEQLGGQLSARVRRVRARLVQLLAYLEATIDFVDDEIPPQAVAAPLREGQGELQAILATADRGLIYRQGVRAAIVGRPNVGKSSLLNALLRGDRAIVTPVPGTTRDTLEETVNIQGVPLAPADWDIARLIGTKPAVLALNKCDLFASVQEERSSLDSASGLLPGARRVGVSALTGEGIDRLENTLADMVLGGSVITADTPLVSNPRHQACLTRALDHVQAAIEAEQGGRSSDLVAIDVRETVDALGEITGETAGEDLLEAIFSQFCIGK
jgi:tRNA modification GTPase